MIGALARKFFGSANDRRVKGYQSRVNAINALEPEIAALSDEALKARTAEFRQQLADGKTLDDILVPAFATVREAAKRTLGQRHFDVQLIGGMVLHEGDIAEMKTGEGKTLVATLAVYLNALAGKGVHVVTVNDYLARRDSELDGPDLQLPRPDHRRDRSRPRRRRAQGGLCLRHHLRHQQRIRLRLSARQHEVPARGHGPARALLRDRRRSRLDPDRRGAHAADHLRPARRPFGILQHHRHLLPEARQDRLRRRREAAHGDADRSRHGEDRERCCATPASSRAIRSTTSRTSPSSTTSTRRCARTRCSRATRTTSSATTRS